ncbi:MAG: branched-chain amino acid aminotransferase [Pseudomonadota bacterium]
MTLEGLAYDDRDGFIWIDGELVAWRDAKVHVLSHALHYADAVFEGERAYGGRIFKSEAHSRRLLESAKIMQLAIPWSLEEIEAAKTATLSANQLSDAYLRMICWRGAGLDMGVAASRNPIHLAVTAWYWGAYYGDAKTKGAKLDISTWKRPSPETIPCQAKAAGLYMICTLSKTAAQAKGCDDALMMDYRGYVAEATGANIFFVRDGTVHTPLADCFLNGITRQTVIELLEHRGIEVVERHIMPDELGSFAQCWLTGSGAEVTPVSEIGPYRFEVGALARQIALDYDRVVRSGR